MSSSINTTEGVPLESSATLVRPLGALERTYYRFSERNPMHFVMPVEFGVALAEEQVRAALNAVQNRHPLLSVQVEDHEPTRLGFYRPGQAPEIELRVLHRDAHDWQHVAAWELAHPFDRSKAPLMRATLIGAETAATILLVFDHTISDGISLTSVVKDLVAALNGRRSEALPVPPAQEDLIARTLPPVEELEFGELPAPDPRMAVPATHRPFDGTLPYTAAITLDGELTAKLIERCRAEETTVHGAIVAAASRVRSTLHDEEFVRVVSPFNLRNSIGAGDNCALYIGAARTGMEPYSGEALWDQARAVSAELAAARSVPGIVAASAAVQQFVPAEADTDTVLEFLLPALSLELLITNLGVLDIDPQATLRPTAVIPPLVLTQAVGEEITGIVTYEGQLRLATCSYTPIDEFLAGVRRTLADACA